MTKDNIFYIKNREMNNIAIGETVKFELINDNLYVTVKYYEPEYKYVYNTYIIVGEYMVRITMDKIKRRNIKLNSLLDNI